MTDDIDVFFKWLQEIDRKGFAFIEVEESLNGIKLPKEFYDFCFNYGVKPKNAVRMIIHDFLIRIKFGNKTADNDIFSKIIKSDKLTKRDKENLIGVMFNDKTKICTRF